MNMQEIRRKSDRYFYEDGLVELMVGVALIWVGITVLAVDNAPRYLTILLVVLLPIVGAGTIYLASRAAEAIKERMVYPRTGYVAYRQTDDVTQRRFVTIGLLFITAVVVLMPNRLNSMGFIQGAVFAFIFALLGYRMGMARFYGLALVSLLIGVGVAFLLPSSSVVATTGTLTGIGIALLVSGCTALLVYLRRNPEYPTHDNN